MHRRLFLHSGLHLSLQAVGGYGIGQCLAFGESQPDFRRAHPPASGVLWSTLGVVADSESDNTAALNALPTGIDIIADAPQGGEVWFHGQWFLRSGLRLHGAGDGSRVIRAVSDIVDRRTASITHADIDRPLQDVVLSGLLFEKTALGKLFKLYVNDFTMRHCFVRHKFGFMFIRGSNQEIAYNTVLTGDSPQGFDGPGLRHMGNYPKASTSDAKPANVWIHHNHIVSHDASYQVDQSDDTWGNNQADDYLFEDNVAHALAGRQILLGGSPSHTTTNIVVRRHSGSATGKQVRIRNGGLTGGGFDKILFEDCDFDASKSTDKYALQILPDNGPVGGITFRRVRVSNPYRCVLKIEAGSKWRTRNVTVEDCVFGQPRTMRRLASVEIDAVIGFTMAGSSLFAGDGAAVLVGARRLCSRLLFHSNAVQGVGDHGIGFDLRTVDNAILSRNSVKRRLGSRRLHGIGFTEGRGANMGTTNTTAIDNDLSDIGDYNGDLAIKFAQGQGNRAQENLGSVDYIG